ncbi:hypothetical protein [Helicobacter pylori]|uniref:hypothetical protein n=1 Tax=Helicobacter pylori TaxID=210 RepID=UPI001E4D2FCD|nr:hypothetical protein [Helicobacter pylori]
MVDETKKCLIDAKKNKQKHFLLIQKANIQARKQAMIDESKTIIQCCSRSGWIGWAYPHTLLAMRSLLHPFKQGMIYKMNDAFGVKMKDSVATSLITGLLGFTPIGQTAKTIVANLIKCIPGVGSVVGAIISGTTAAVITEGIGFAYLKALETCFNDEIGEVKLPAMDTIIPLFKESYLSLDTIKKLKD